MTTILVIAVLLGVIAILFGAYRNPAKRCTRDLFAEDVEAALRRRPKHHLT